MFGKNRNSKGVIGLVKKALVIFMCYSLVFSTFIPVLMAAEIKSLTEMKHNPPKYFVPDHRIQLDADVSDPAGVELVRCYFKAAGEADFVFVPMANTEKNDYAGILPAPSPATEQIEYLFLAVNRNNEVVKSQSFIINREEKKEAPAWQEIAKEGEIQVSMELDQVPAELAGFSDSIAMNAVESGLRFGVVAGGLYLSKAGESASVSGKAAAATNAGTITAEKRFNSAILAAVLGGAVLAGAGGGGGGGGSSTPPVETLVVSANNITACVVDHNAIQDDYYDMYLNGAFVGKVEMPVGGTVCHNITLNSGNNLLELRLTRLMGQGTLLQINLNNGEAIKTFQGSMNHQWNVVAP
ncbi:MAG TPA: hypothetical protein PK874_09780 [Desulfobacteraceae bacterium]|nr:hypothetical protein [Desulfobacteraceae bacterium]HPJ68158.1 hypothetical protein [Desulfobacteraceae bacterium]